METVSEAKPDWSGETGIYCPRFEAAAWEVEHALNAAQWILARPHPNLIRIFEAEVRSQRPVVSYERGDGFRLLDVLRCREALPLSEVLPLAKQLAAACDHADTHGIPWLDFSVRGVAVVFDHKPSHNECRQLAKSSASSWPPHKLLVAPHGFHMVRGLLGDPSAPASVPPPLPRPAPCSSLRDFAICLHALLGGICREGVEPNLVHPPLACLTARQGGALAAALHAPYVPRPGAAMALVEALG